MKPPNTFMTCKWKDLIMVNYQVEKHILEPYLPANVELDLHNGKAVLSLVAFTFSNVKFFGFKVPFHQRFAQINFRFYVKSKTDGSKGVVFIKEFAPKHLIAFVGNKIYNEPYYYKNIGLTKALINNQIELRYTYKNTVISAKANLKTEELKKNTLKHFIVDRYIAFINTKTSKTVRYNIYHKPWKTYELNNWQFNKDLLKLLPSHFKNLKHLSTYLVNGSDVYVQKGMLQ